MSRRDCESIRPLISAFFDGDLSPSESVRLHQHLATCEDCRQIIDEYQRIRSGFRELPVVPTPPENLSNRVWAETVDRPKPTGIRRLFGATTAKVGLSTVGALAVVAVIVAFLLVRGYSQGITPSVVGSTPVSAQNWPIYQPVKIHFNKSMNHQSVEENLQIWPPGERTRIPTSWDGNTLILGTNSIQSAPFLPDTTYQVMVLETAQDAFGHQLGKTWSLSFRTSPIATTALNATPTPEASVTSSAFQQPTNTPAATAASPSPTPTASSDATSTNPGSTQALGPTPTIVPSTPTPTTPAIVTVPTQPSAPTPTPLPTQSPQPTPTVAVTPTPSPSPTPAPATPQPATPTTTPPAVSGTPTAAAVPVTGAFGSVYWGNADVQTKLGAPKDPEVFINAAELGFQRGTMYERFDTGEIYVFFANNEWAKFKDTWQPSDGEGGGPGPDAGLWVPKERFWKVWNSDPSLASSIGYAVEQDAHLMTTSGGSFQTFANGIMLYSDRGFVYVVYDDLTWALYPDTSGHGDLITPTPEASPPADTTPTSTSSATPAATATDAATATSADTQTAATSSSGTTPVSPVSAAP